MCNVGLLWITAYAYISNKVYLGSKYDIEGNAIHDLFLNQGCVGYLISIQKRLIAYFSANIIIPLSQDSAHHQQDRERERERFL